MEATRFRLERLDVWRKAIEFANSIYKVTSEFSGHERYGLTSQMHLAAVSISSNIAEGSSRSSDVDFARFLEIAYGSLMECVSQMYISKAQGFLKASDFEALYTLADEVGRMPSSFRTPIEIMAL